MKTQMRKPSAGKSHYATEYKEDAVKHWKDSGRSAATVAAELGIRAPLLYRWAKQLRLAAQQGGQPEEKTAARVGELEARIRQLSEENAKLLEQREVLKKSLGILSEAPRSGMPKSSR
jgi:transposase-like protein